MSELDERFPELRKFIDGVKNNSTAADVTNLEIAFLQLIEAAAGQGLDEEKIQAQIANCLAAVQHYKSANEVLGWIHQAFGKNEQQDVRPEVTEAEDPPPEYRRVSPNQLKVREAFERSNGNASPLEGLLEVAGKVGEKVDTSDEHRVTWIHFPQGDIDLWVPDEVLEEPHQYRIIDRAEIRKLYEKRAVSPQESVLNDVAGKVGIKIDANDKQESCIFYADLGERWLPNDILLNLSVSAEEASQADNSAAAAAAHFHNFQRSTGSMEPGDGGKSGHGKGDGGPGYGGIGYMRPGFDGKGGYAYQRGGTNYIPSIAEIVQGEAERAGEGYHIALCRVCGKPCVGQNAGVDWIAIGPKGQRDVHGMAHPSYSATRWDFYHPKCAQLKLGHAPNHDHANKANKCVRPHGPCTDWHLRGKCKRGFHCGHCHFHHPELRDKYPDLPAGGVLRRPQRRERLMMLRAAYEDELQNFLSKPEETIDAYMKVWGELMPGSDPELEDIQRNALDKIVNGQGDEMEALHQWRKFASRDQVTVLMMYLFEKVQFEKEQVDAETKPFEDLVASILINVGRKLPDLLSIDDADSLAGIPELLDLFQAPNQTLQQMSKTLEPVGGYYPH
mmetsp:Transcript_42474/g.99668  ORF Transcript_42474/g.99668 Transcript_42474/m.99668 type:complete len:615 (+) Transcript_42474:62-1906(+)